MAIDTRRKPRFTRRHAGLWLATALVAPGIASGHGDAKHQGDPRAPSDEQHPWGREGDPRHVSRTITLAMRDAMRFSPDRLQVRLGETLRLRVRNRGALLHELVIGTEAELAAHAELMRRHPGMEHDAPYMAHVAAGRHGDIVWNFNRAGTFHFACLIPGHWEAGMRGQVHVR